MDALENRCSYRLLSEWQDYLIWAAKGKTGEREIAATGEELAAALAAATGAKIIRKGEI